MSILFYVNGRKICLEEADPEVVLAHFLRENLRLTGTKVGCGEGGCGACTVMLSYFDTTKDKVVHIAVNACLLPLCYLDGKAVTTVEGIGSTKTKLHPCQERIARAHGTQCGFCTPGFVMSMYSLLRNNITPTEMDIEEAVSGNLCRCTGYRPILEGCKTFAKDICCKSGGKGCCLQKKATSSGSSKTPPILFETDKLLPLDPTQDPIFPPELKLQRALKPLAIRGQRVTWYRPTCLDQLLELRARFLDQPGGNGKIPSKLVAGNTEIGVDVKFKGELYDVLISSSQVPELNKIDVTDCGLLVGASITLNQLAGTLGEVCESLPGYNQQSFMAILKALKWFAGPQIRNVATLGGNICAASPISDLNPILVAVGAELNLANKDSSRTIRLDEKFFIGHKKTALKQDEVLISVLIPFTKEHEFVCSYKQSRRREDDIAIVNAGLRVTLSPGEPHWTVKDCCLCYGGMSYVTTVARKTMSSLIEKPWCESTLKEATSSLLKEYPMKSDVPGGMPEYRRSLVTSFFFKFYLSVLSQVQEEPLPPEIVTATKAYQSEPVKGTQSFQHVPKGQIDHDAIGRPMMHLSALEHTTGEARYFNDIPPAVGELYAGLVLSSRSHAKIRVDYSEAIRMEGVAGYVGVDDVPGCNLTGLGKDELIFADGKVNYIGQLIGIIAADSLPLAQRAAKAVQITYEDLPSIITIKDAISANSFYSTVPKLEHGDVDAAFSDSEHTIEGEIRIGGQEHFYMETQGCIAIPKGEGGEMEVISSTQCPKQAQECVAETLGVPANRVVVRVKRIGGGFGGKDTKSLFLASAAAVVANKIQVPVKIVLDRNEDMIWSSGRHPYLGKYKVAFTSKGRVSALDLQLFSNGGYGTDYSISVCKKSVAHSDNAYNIPNFRVIGKVCLTNLAPSTAFRGFGGPQGMFLAETWMSHIANYLGLSTEVVQELNLYSECDCTPWGQVLVQCNIRRCWDNLREVYEKRRLAVESNNSTHRWSKRGIALVPTKLGVSFSTVSYAQAGALLHVYTDGSVLLTHGGMEMGQGLHTKMVQVCAHYLNIPTENVFIAETSTNTVPNASSTASSVSSDLYGMAVKDCCCQIMERLQPLMDRDPGAGWCEWVKRAYLRRINLSAQGFYDSKRDQFDWKAGKGNMYPYFVYGASFSEVEVDVLTGDFKVLRTDIVMDAGNSLNPAIDIGQVEGAFTQGLGLFTLEEHVYLEGNRNTQRGALFTTGPGTYKIPSVSDIPREFNVSLLDKAPNPQAIFSSKGLGEAPLFLAGSVFFAIKDAIKNARYERGITGHFVLDSPATCERIRMACTDQFTEQACAGIDIGAKRWTIQI